jgi:SEC-C motif-containing protein
VSATADAGAAAVPDACPCGSGGTYAACCEPFIEGKAQSPTAEALLRSRYSAFTRKKVDYILATHHSSTRGEVSRESVQAWADRAEWVGLEVLGREAGGPSDDEGVVRFVARYRERGAVVNHAEDARFAREEGAWRFVTSASPPARRSAPKVGRNDPCSCGSGKKYKKCCGAA